MPQAQPNHEHVFGVSELNREVKWLLDSTFGQVWVEGELSNLTRPGSGHLYFSLVDANSQIRCAMFRGDNRRLDFKPANGQSVLCRGRLGIYEARGDYQLIVDRMIETGAGALQRQFEETKRRLQAEGLFDTANKLALPPFPKTIGLLTSPTGAAVQDALNVLSRRYPLARVIIYPVPVQGATAAPAIAQMLERANRRAECDVLLVLRGGGSLEDLWPFNEEAVARAIYRSSIPVISGVGHEIDFTIADMAADLRAPTPSAAAELSTPDGQELLGTVLALHQRLRLLAAQRLARQQQNLREIMARLRRHHPIQRLRQSGQRVDELEIRLRRLMNNCLSRAAVRHQHLQRSLLRSSPSRLLARRREQRQVLQHRLQQLIGQDLQRRHSRLMIAARALSAVSPLNTLKRGYSIVQTVNGAVVTDATQVDVGENVEIRLNDGNLSAEIRHVHASKKGKNQST
jgi:exodeoxyribonuclease VII large subunit